jgi:transcription factor E
MLKDLLKEVLVILVGKQSEEIVDLLDGDKYVNEFLIAKKINLTINQTRNILYKISDSGLVSSIRKKDKKKGWYTYFWKIEVLKSLEFLKEIITKSLIQLKNQIKSRETKRFYFCERCNVEFTEENAMLRDFTCNECGEVFSIKSNEKVLKEFKKNEEKLEKRLELVNEEIKREKEKIDKIKQKEIKKQEQEKIKKKQEMKKESEKAKNKLAKINKKETKNKKEIKKTNIKKSSKIKKTIKKK